MSSSSFYSELMIKFTSMVAESLDMEEIPFNGTAEIAVHVTNKIQLILQEARKAYIARKGSRLAHWDLTTAFNNTSLPMPLGMQACTRGELQTGNINGKKFCYCADRPISVIKSSFQDHPLVCRKGRLHGHWLAVDGVTLDVPENVCSRRAEEARIVPETQGKAGKLWGGPHLLMLHCKYLTRVVQSCVGDDSSERQDAFSSLSSDTGLQQNVPFILNFVAEGIRAHLGSLHNPRVLVNLLLMIDSLLSNPSISLERYLEGIVPELLSCVVCARIGQSIDQLAMRMTAAKLTARVACTFDTPSNHLHGRITSILAHVDWTQLSLFATFGVICGLGELGRHVIRTFLLPALLTISARLIYVQDSICSNDDKVVESIIDKIKLYVSPLLPEIGGLREDAEEYFNDVFGLFGPVLYAELANVVHSPNPHQSDSDHHLTSDDTFRLPTARIRAVVLSNEDLD